MRHYDKALRLLEKADDEDTRTDDAQLCAIMAISYLLCEILAVLDRRETGQR